MGVDPIILAHEAPFDIGPVQVRPEVREIEYDGRLTVLEPRVMQVLVALTRANGHVVSKDDLASCCWEGRVVGDDAINRVISRLRHNAQEDAGGTFKVETITKVGYRLILGSGASVQRSEPMARRSILAAGAALAGTAAIGGALWWNREGPSPEDVELTEIRRTLLQGTPDQTTSAEARLHAFLAAHPRSADGWGLSAVVEYFMPGGTNPRARVLRDQRVTASARRALAIDPKQPDARTALASLPGFPRRWTQAYRSIAPVFKDRPDAFYVNNFMASLFAQTGLSERSLAHADRALKAESQAPPIWMLKAQALDNLGRLPEAQAAIEEAYDRWPRQTAVFFTRLYLLGYNGRTAEALAMIASPADWPVGIPADNQAFTKSQIIALGDRRPAAVDEAMQWTGKLAAKGTGFAENAIQFVAAMGMNDEAFALAERYFFDPNFIQSRTRFSEEQRVYSKARTTLFLFRRPMIGLWRDPRFESLVDRIGLGAFWRDTGFVPEFRQSL